MSEYYLGFPNHGTGGVACFRVRNDKKVVMSYIAWCPKQLTPYTIMVAPEGRRHVSLTTAGWIEEIDDARAVWSEMVRMGFVRITLNQFLTEQERFSTRREQP